MRRAVLGTVVVLVALSGSVVAAEAAGTDHNCNGVVIGALARTLQQNPGEAGQLSSGLAKQQQRDEFAHSFTEPYADCGATP
jgi:hypothetical protein